MEFTKLLRSDEERAVSPVIGVILMVAITVILAAVIGTFVLGLGDQVQTTAPNAQFSFDYQSGASNPTLDITHDGGDGVAGDELIIMGDVASSGAWNAGGSTVRAGQSITVADSGEDFDWDTNYVDADGDGTIDNVEDGTEIRVVWQDSDSEQSSTLRTWTK